MTTATPRLETEEDDHPWQLRAIASMLLGPKGEEARKVLGEAADEIIALRALNEEAVACLKNIAAWLETVHVNGSDSCAQAVAYVLESAKARP